MRALRLIKDRRSVRKFKKRAVSRQTVNKILEAGRWAPSGLNNQPWRFMVLDKEKKDALAVFTHYGHIIKSADKLILVFLDKKTSYNYEKDLMAIGSCIQNILLCIHSKKLGACWLGEILNQKKKVHKYLKLRPNLELEAVIALGAPVSYPRLTKRKKLKSLIIK
ncbi:MAG: nitroreductase family protein [Candidatus Omnitrophica bacterium]|nr:nitroreductase family protein [Candidatus Omnitrophota bacterium]